MDSHRSIILESHLAADWTARELREDASRALRSNPKIFPPRCLYDDEGSRLFDAITKLPEYYPTEAERSILRRYANEIVTVTEAETLVELGSGTSDKTRTLLDAFRSGGRLRRFVPFDVSEATLVDAANALAVRYPGLEIRGVVGDFTRHLAFLPDEGRRLVAFLGGTIGNLYVEERRAFLGALADRLHPGEWLLLGVDLVKPVQRIVNAYDDPGGLSAAFVRNLLHVLNRELHANFNVDAFDYVPLWDAREERMDLRLRPAEPQHVHVADLGFDVEIAAGEELHVEISSKFRVDALAAELADVGFDTRRAWTDERDDFGLLLARRA